MPLPARIFDLHTHLFNARYLPLASVIAHAMGRDHSPLARQVARLLQALTGSAYVAVPVEAVFAAPVAGAPEAWEQACLEHIWRVTEHELLLSTGSLRAIEPGTDLQMTQSLDAPVFDRLRASEWMEILLGLEQIDYAAEGAAQGLLAPAPGEGLYPGLEIAGTFPDFLDWARRVVKKALQTVVGLMDPRAWGEGVNYPAFFLTLLHSEEQLLQKFWSSYGPGLPPLQSAHYLLDMQPAFRGQEAPYYPLHPVQEDRMQNLQRAHPALLFGFSAFDPRRDDWRERALDALAKGFVGFKFYPAMGFKPVGNAPPIQAHIDAFFDFCVARDLPVFTHCTPVGFQTRFKLGAYAHPRYWHEVLQQPRWHGLRLCLGHAGGGRMENGPLHSAGWMARTEAEWQDPDNFARIVTELCTTCPSVYCEVGYLMQLLQDEGLAVFEANLQRARREARQGGRPFELLDKMAYGSDWHMPDVIGRTRQYLERFLGLMERPEYAGHREQFFWGNAYRFLRLPL